MRWIFFILTCAVLFNSCSGRDKQEEAEELLRQANERFEKGDYADALSRIDSLRRIYPNAIDTRKKALKLYQDIELKQAQQELAATDSLLQQVSHNYDYQKIKVEKDKAELRATPEELTMFTQTRIKRDSLRTRCEVLGAKIRYIHKKQTEIK